jgi:hypothetical protein
VIALANVASSMMPASSRVALLGIVPFVLVLRCNKEQHSAGGSASSPSPTPTAHVEGANYKVDTSVSGCVAGTECTATVRLEAAGGYHINEDYPYKLVANAAPGVEFLGKDVANPGVFGKVTGDFDKRGEKLALLTVRFKAPKGSFSFTGKYKMSICSDANCQIEQPELSFDGIAK